MTFKTFYYTLKDKLLFIILDISQIIQLFYWMRFKKWEKVSQFDMNHTFIQTFPSIKEAADTLKLNSGKISAVVNGKRKTTGNYIFKFAA